MLKNHLKDLLNQNLTFVPTGDQEKLISGLSDFIITEAQDTIF